MALVQRCSAGFDAGWLELAQVGTARSLSAAMALVGVLLAACSGGMTSEQSSGGAGGQGEAPGGIGGQGEAPGGTGGQGGGPGGTGGQGEAPGGTGGTYTGGSPSGGGPVEGGAPSVAHTYRSKVSYAGGQYFLLGVRERSTYDHEGFILTSSDAKTWGLVHREKNASLRSFARGSDAWFAGGEIYDRESGAHEGVLLRSEDGVHWSKMALPANVRWAREIAWTGTRLLLAASDQLFGWHAYVAEADGSWTALEPPVLDNFVESHGVTVAMGQNRTTYRSLDGGRTFNQAQSLDASPITSVVGLWATDGGFEGTAYWDCCAGEQTSGNRLYRVSSQDGTSWAIEQSDAMAPSGVAEHDGVWVGIQYNGFALLRRAAQSEPWLNVDSTALFTSVTAGDHFVAAGVDEAGIRWSDDGLSWHAAESVEEPE